MSKALILVLCMIATIGIFICSLLFLGAIDSRIQMVIVFSTVIVFCVLGAKLLVCISSNQKYTYKVEMMNKHLVMKNTQMTSSIVLCDNLIKLGYTLQGGVIGEYSDKIKFFRKTTQGKRFPSISNIFVMDSGTDIDSYVLEKVDKSLASTVIKNEKSQKIIAAKRRSVIFCAFCRNENRAVIQDVVSKATFTFSLLLPIVVDVSNNSVNHANIPLTYSSEKGKALVELSQLVSSIFYST